MKKKMAKKAAILTAAMVFMLSSTTVSAQGTYTTKPGDNLSKIAQEMYGDPLKWSLIYETNKSQIKDPNIIFSNQILTIPDLEGEAPLSVPEVPDMPVTEEIPSVPVTDEVSTTVAEEPSVSVPENMSGTEKGYTLGVLAIMNIDTGKIFSQIYLKTDRNADWHLWYAEPLPEGSWAYENNFNIPNEYLALRIICDDGTEFTWECDSLRVGWDYNWGYDENGACIGRVWDFYEEGTAEGGVQIYPSIDGTATISWM